MNKESFKNVFKNVGRFVDVNSPAIMTGVGITGMLTTTVFAVKATPKALFLIDEAENEKNDSLTISETIKATWKCYIPAFAMATTSTICLIGANRVSTKRAAVLTTAYKLSETAFTEYREKVIETIGEKKEKTVRDKVNKEKVAKKPVENKSVIITGKGDTLCFDPLSGQYFKSDIDKINKAVNAMNKRMLSNDYISLNEFYDELGIVATAMGDDLGWCINEGMIDIYFSSQLDTDGNPCVVIDFNTPPRYDFNRY